MKKLLLILAALLSPSDLQAKPLRPSTTAEFASTTVMIMNMEHTGGGSGVIYRSTDDYSFILTNEHICALVKHGGIVIKNNVTHVIVAFKPSKGHDICLIQIRDNLHVTTVLAKDPPKLYEEAIIAGHPHLLPETVVKGHFSKHQVLDIQVGVRGCTADEFDRNEFMCTVSGMPVIQNSDSQLVTATILPGSSGSPVFNSDGEIAGLVFASDSRELAYAEIVPFEYLKYFLAKEIGTSKWLYPMVRRNPLPLQPRLNKKHLYTLPIYYINEHKHD